MDCNFVRKEQQQQKKNIGSGKKQRCHWAFKLFNAFFPDIQQYVL